MSSKDDIRECPAPTISDDPAKELEEKLRALGSDILKAPIPERLRKLVTELRKLEDRD